LTGEIQIKDLIVSKMLRQDLDKYRSLFSHVSAALQLTEAGKSLVRGDTIQYIYTDAAQKNPFRWVTPLDLFKEHDYDKEKYRETLFEAAESILGYFGFDRTVYGDRKKNRKRWYEIREERRKDIKTERDVHDG
jgi:DNA polymerase elongation subunit (family B)